VIVTPYVDRGCSLTGALVLSIDRRATSVPSCCSKPSSVTTVRVSNSVLPHGRDKSTGFEAVTVQRVPGSTG